jgi:hypothetical protein
MNAAENLAPEISEPLTWAERWSATHVAVG